jgi:cyclopropane fatty-acyl-phospholipid synthase-like methyltransferase
MVGQDTDELRALIANDRYPRSAKYDPEWVIGSFTGGPNVLWSIEALCEHLPFEAGMRVLDLACGTAHSSIFLAREFDVTVWAVDLMVSPTKNWKRVRDAGVADRVFPLHGDARRLPLPEGMFDAIVCAGSYVYFGTDDLYLRTLRRFLCEGGRIGIVTKGVRTEVEAPPDDASSIWKQQFEVLHTPDWWRRHFERSGLVDVEAADMLPEGGRDWARWSEICMTHGDADPRLFRKDAEMLRRDNDERFGSVRLVARLR